MRNLLAIALTFALVFFGMAISHVSRGLTAHEDVVLERVANMTSKKSHKSNAKANDIYMEINAPRQIGMPDLVAIVIPENKSGTAVSVELSVGITNNTSLPFPIRQYGGLIPELVGPEGQIKRPQEPINRQFGTRENDWILVRGRDTSQISLTAKLSWRNNSLQLQVPTHPDHWQVPITPDNSWTFDTLGTGIYQIRFTYDSPSKEILSSNPKTRLLAELEGIATRRLVTPFANLRLVQPVEHDKSAVEVDGIRFKTFVQQVLNVPKKEPGEKESLKLAGIRITNNRSNPVCFSLYTSLIPEIVGADGEIVPRGYFSDMLISAQESDFVLAMPGKNITFFPKAGLWWLNEDKFLLIIDAGDGGGWTFQPLKLGNYHIHFTYANSTNSSHFDDIKTGGGKQMENIWTGIVTTPFVEFHLTRN